MTNQALTAQRRGALERMSEPVVDQHGIPVNPEPLKVVPAARRQAWTRQPEWIPSCSECGSSRSARVWYLTDAETPSGVKYKAKAWRCVDEAGCRRRQRREELI